MEKITIPPFYVGQEVVALNNDKEGIFKKGDEFKVTSCIKGCCEWEVTIGIMNTDWINSVCTKCGKKEIIGNKEIPFYASRFAPITSTFQSISLTKVLETELPLIGVN